MSHRKWLRCRGIQKSSQLEPVSLRASRVPWGICAFRPSLYPSARTDSWEGNDTNADFSYCIVCSHFQFVTHSYSQLLLNKEVYGGVPWLERKSRWLIFGFSVLIMAVFPLAMAVFTFINVVLSPSHQLSRVVSSPMMKYLTSFSSYILFLALLIYSAFQPMKDFLAFSVAGECGSCLNDMAVCLTGSGPGFWKQD